MSENFRYLQVAVAAATSTTATATSTTTTTMHHAFKDRTCRLNIDDFEKGGKNGKLESRCKHLILNIRCKTGFIFEGLWHTINVLQKI